MPNLKVMTFNVENMLVRFDFRKCEKESLATLLDIDSEMDRANLIRTHYNVINDENRVFTALTIKEEDRMSSVSRKSKICDPWKPFMTAI